MGRGEAVRTKGREGQPGLGRIPRAWATCPTHILETSAPVPVRRKHESVTEDGLVLVRVFHIFI